MKAHDWRKKRHARRFSSLGHVKKAPALPLFVPAPALPTPPLPKKAACEARFDSRSSRKSAAAGTSYASATATSGYPGAYSGSNGAFFANVSALSVAQAFAGPSSGLGARRLRSFAAIEALVRHCSGGFGPGCRWKSGMPRISVASAPAGRRSRGGTPGRPAARRRIHLRCGECILQPQATQRFPMGHRRDQHRAVVFKADEAAIEQVRNCP